MFKCDFCKGTSKPREKLALVPVEIREVVYLNHRVDEETEETIEVVSRGNEIVREKKACQSCVAKDN
jgi:hypothetical protein